jgi:TrmH family RNA methyltransferase
MVDVGLDEVAAIRPTLVVVCAEVRDPGNLGTIVRSAAAAGAGAVVCCSRSVDLYNPKVVRSSAGMLFHVPVVAGPEAPVALDEIGRWGLRRWGTDASRGCDYSSADLASPVALVFGNESHGLGPPTAGRLDGTLTIPMADGSESINVASAASVICFEAARQRRAAAS